MDRITLQLVQAEELDEKPIQQNAVMSEATAINETLKAARQENPTKDPINGLHTRFLQI